MVSDSDSLSSSISSPVDPVQEPQNDLEKASTHHTNRSTRPNGPQRITTAQDWSGPDDPENPLNWALSKKMYHVAMVGSQAFVTTYGSSVISPSVPDISAHFNISTTAAILPLTLYVLGLAFGPMISAPISETFGRRIVYLALFPPSLLFTLGAGFSSSFASLLVCRFFAGALGSGCLAIGAGTNSDIWIPRHRAAASSVFLLAPFLGPAFGPPVGGYVSFYKGWRWTQWTILFAGTGAYLFGIFQSETYKKIILAKRAKKLGLPPPPNPLPPGFARIKFLILVTILRPARMLVTEPIVAYLSIYTAFNFSVLFAFFAAFPLVFQSPYPEIQIYHFTQGRVRTSIPRHRTRLLPRNTTVHPHRQINIPKEDSLTQSNRRHEPPPPRRKITKRHGRRLPLTHRSLLVRLDRSRRYPLDLPHPRTHTLRNGQLDGFLLGCAVSHRYVWTDGRG